MAGPIPADARINLSQTSVLLIDDNPQSLDLLSAIVQSFGVKDQIKCASAVEAKKLIGTRKVDLILIDCASPELDSCGFVKWLRREGPRDKAYTPAIIVTGYASSSFVEQSRDCGASFIVAKPITPAVLVQRIVWLTKDERQFIECDTYVGPDRRVRNVGPPLGVKGRRSGDLSEHVGHATEPNMDQSEIDMLMKPQKVAL